MNIYVQNDRMAAERKAKMEAVWAELRKAGRPVKLSSLTLYPTASTADYLLALTRMGCVERPAQGWYVATSHSPEWCEIPEEEPVRPKMPPNPPPLTWETMFKGWT